MVSNPMKKFRRPVDDPTMSDATLLLKVEDLIGLTFGTGDTNIINFKILQTILHILAGQMRMLQQDVEIRFAEEDDVLIELKKAYEKALELESAENEIKEEEKDKPKKGGKAEKTPDTQPSKPTDKIEKPKPPDDKPSKKEEAKGGKKGKAKKGVDEKSTKVDDSTSTRVKRGSTAESVSQTRIGSIEVVTASQFNILDSMVQNLLKRTGGVPLPTMPSNEDLLTELAKGTASLPDTMEAMQVNARVRAVEHALTKMAGLLTQLASSGALPTEVAAIIAQMQIDLQQLSLTTGIEPEPLKSMKSVAIDTSSSVATAKEDVKGKEVIPTVPSATTLQNANVTHPEMHEALSVMRDDLLKNMSGLTAKSESNTDQASRVVKALVDKMDVALKLDSRISTIQAMTADYSQQLQGFDAGLNLQLQNFKEQMGQLRNELAGGLVQLEAANSNAESAALIDLKSNYENLLVVLEHTTNNHGTLVMLQKNLTSELKHLVECVELLREEKADRDEVADGLRDKANISRLKGLLRMPQFEETRQNLEYRLNLSYDKFRRQEQVWTTALRELSEITASKASFMDLLALKEYTTRTLNEHFNYLRKLEYALGEPKTALLTRQLARDGQCGPCMLPALMEPKHRQLPLKLPTFRRKDDDEEEPCMPAPVRPDADAERKHVCKRWVGGSHTLLSEHITRDHATPALVNEVPTKQYTGVGTDGRLYLLEEELQPCIECNKISSEDAPPPSEDGGGDIA